MKITKVKAREILDSRGNPTVEVDIFSGKQRFRSSVPSGASTGIHEAIELRDGNKRYGGKGVEKAVKNVNTIISRKIRGLDPVKDDIDYTLLDLDGTENKSRLGANAMLAVSLSSYRMAAAQKKMPLYRYIKQKAKTKISMPRPFFNVINGGKHASNKLNIQEFMISPRAPTFKKRLQMGSETYHQLKEIISKKYNVNVGDEGGFAPNIRTMNQALDLLMQAIDKAGYAKKIDIAMDVAASEFFNKGKYRLNSRFVSANRLSSVYHKAIDNYPIISLEDPFAEDDFDSWTDFMRNRPKQVQVVGDDLLCTNPSRINMASQHKLCNALLLKVNQIGTVSEAIEATKIAFKNDWRVMVSHRSGETCDDFIADLSVGLGAGQIKSGAPCRSERLAKYNQLLRIEEEIR